MGYKQTEIGMIPDEWKTELLGNLVEKVFCGRDPKGGKRSHSKEVTNIHIIQSAAVFDGYLDLNKTGYISDEIAQNLKSASINEDDVLLNQLGDGITFARSCVVHGKAIPSIITRSVGCIRCKPELLDPWFLNAYLVLPRTKKYIESFNSGSSRRAIDGGKMKSFILPIPPIDEQRKIGAIYKNILRKIEINRQISHICENIGQALFKHWFIDFEFPNEKGKPYKSSGGEMIYNEELEKEIPKEWKVYPLQKISQVTDCLHSKKPSQQETGHLFLQVFNIGNNGELDLSDRYFINSDDYKLWTSRVKIKEGDIIISKTGRVGAVAQIPENIEGAIGRNLVCIRSLNHIIGKSYLKEYMLSPLIKKEIYIRTSTGTVLQSLHVKEIERLRITVPKRDIIDKFEKTVLPLHSQIISYLFENRILSQIMKTILPKLVSGKIRVKIPTKSGEQ